MRLPWLAVALVTALVSAGCVGPGPSDDGTEATDAPSAAAGPSGDDSECPPSVPPEHAQAGGMFFTGQPGTVAAWRTAIEADPEEIAGPVCQDADATTHIYHAFHFTEFDEVLFQVTGGDRAAPDGISLISPSGERWPLGTEDEEAGVFLSPVEEGFFGPGFHIALEAPEDGVWVLDVIGDPDDVFLGGQMFVDSPYTLAFEEDGYAVVGEPYTLIARFEGPDGPVTNARVEGVVAAGSMHEGPPVIRFRDDGVAPDQTADDGVYTAVIVPTEAGSPEVVIEGFAPGVHRSAEDAGFLIMTPDDPFLPRHEE